MNLNRRDDARLLLRQLYPSAVDLQPDHANNTLTVRLHHFSSKIHVHAIAKLRQELTERETVFSGTHLRLIFQFFDSSKFQRIRRSELTAFDQDRCCLTVMSLTVAFDGFAQ